MIKLHLLHTPEGKELIMSWPLPWKQHIVYSRQLETIDTLPAWHVRLYGSTPCLQCSGIFIVLDFICDKHGHTIDNYKPHSCMQYQPRSPQIMCALLTCTSVHLVWEIVKLMAGHYGIKMFFCIILSLAFFLYSSFFLQKFSHFHGFGMCPGCNSFKGSQRWGFQLRQKMAIS